MSNPKGNKGKNIRTRQSVMGDFFSKSEQSKKSTTVKNQKKTAAGEIVAKEQEVVEKKLSASQKKAVEKKKVETVGKKTNETVEKASAAADKKADKGVEKKTSLKRKVTGAGMFSFSWTRGAQRDTEEYRNGYPGKTDFPDLDDNLRFYMNQIPSKPDGDFVDKIHVDWWGDYKLLEVHHGYIQWLFPIRESGLNWHAQELQLHEIKKIQRSKKAMKRVLTSYKMMLDFYGMKLDDEEDGTIVRADNWRDRFRHLNRSYHNYLRITRILKCLGEFGYEHLKKNFVQFILYEGLEKGTLSNLIDSCVKYWIGVLKEDEDREEMFDYYEKLTYDENLSAKRRNRSPSPPPTWSSWQTNSKTGKKVISKPTDNGKAKSPKKSDEKDKDDKNQKQDNEFSDDEDSTLYYAMNLIDDDEQETSGSKEKKVKDKQRKEHEMSDSGEDEEHPSQESQEMEYWNDEAKKANQDDIEVDSESYDSIQETDVKESVDNKIADSVEQQPVSSKNKENAGDNDVTSNEELETERREKGTRESDCKEQVETEADVEKTDLPEKTDSKNDIQAVAADFHSEPNAEKDTVIPDAELEKMETSEKSGMEHIEVDKLETNTKVGDVCDGTSTDTDAKQDDEEEKMETT